VKLLLSYSASVTIKDKSNKRPVDLATNIEIRPILDSYEFRINTNSILQENNEIDDIPPIPDKSFENLSLSARTSRTHSRSNSDNWTMNSRKHSRNNSANVSIDISNIDS